jgi:hypothetical protein
MTSEPAKIYEVGDSVLVCDKERGTTAGTVEGCRSFDRKNRASSFAAADFPDMKDGENIYMVKFNQSPPFQASVLYKFVTRFEISGKYDQKTGELEANPDFSSEDMLVRHLNHTNTNTQRHNKFG